MIGEKLRQARLEAGLSQRLLCGDVITRNMLSCIENGSAQPSMRTLQYLAGRLGKPISYFLDEQAVVSSNLEVMASARQSYDLEKYAETVEILQKYSSPDSVYDREKALLDALSRLGLAEKAISQKKNRYAREILENIDTQGIYCAEALNRRRLLLLGKLGIPNIAAQLPSMDEELFLRASEAIRQGDFPRGACLLEAMQRQDSPQWNLLRGEAYLSETAYQEAIICFLLAEKTMPEAVIPKLEHCYREIGDFKQAYLYACKQKK